MKFWEEVTVLVLVRGSSNVGLYQDDLVDMITLTAALCVTHITSQESISCFYHDHPVEICPDFLFPS